MQISTQEVERLLHCPRSAPSSDSHPVASVRDLAERLGVAPGEVQEQVAELLAAEEDPHRERRVQELLARIRSNSYAPDAATIVDMAERRAIADRNAGAG
jgi:hypothetical protein